MIHRYPFVQQREQKDCGVACLEMILKYYHGFIPMEQLREHTHTTKNGTTAYHLIKTATELGFEAKGIACMIENVKSGEVVLPCIAHVVIENSYKHFIVIYEIDNRHQQLVIADPASHIRKISFQEFETIWSNVVIQLFPIQKIPCLDCQHSFREFLFTIIREYQKEMIQLGVLSLFATIFAIAIAFYLNLMVERLGTSEAHLIFLTVVFGSIAILKLITDFCRNQLLCVIHQKIDLHLTLDTMRQLFSLPYRYYRNHTTGEMISRITDLSMIKDVIGRVTIGAMVDFPLSIGAFVFLSLLSFPLAMGSLLLFLLYLLCLFFFHPVYQKLIHQYQEKKGKTTSYMVESLSAFETVKGLGIERIMEDTLEKSYLPYLNTSYTLEKCYQKEQLVKELGYQVIFHVLILTACFMVMRGSLHIGALLTFQSLFLYFIGPIQNIIELDTSLREAKGSFERILELQRSKETQGVIANWQNGDIVCQHLSYTIDDHHEILKDLSFKISEGSKVMLIGKSGSGKSTILHLLKGYDKIPRGTIQIGKIDLLDYENTTISENVTYLSQEEQLFTGSLKDNLCLCGNSEHFIEMATLCEVEEMIDPKLGYHMLIEENGANLSGGERQRVILARTILKPFQILLIDEGMNQMDINLERRILKRLFEKYHDKTIIVVSHRFDNKDLFDQILELEEGRIIQDVRKNKPTCPMLL